MKPNHTCTEPGAAPVVVLGFGGAGVGDAERSAVHRADTRHRIMFTE